MKFRGNKILGLAIGQRSILIAELNLGAGGVQLSRSAEFSYAGAASLDNPAALGLALGEFLKSEQFTSRTAVFGVPARWVVTRAKEVPPVDPTLAADLLRMQSAAEFSSELKDLIYDYAGQTSASVPTNVLLAAMPRQYLTALETIADAARLTLIAVTPTSMALAAAAAGDDGESLVLSITRSAAELTVRRGKTPSLLRHIGATSTGVNALVAGEVRRASLQFNGNGKSPSGVGNGQPSGHIVVWDDLGGDVAAGRSYTETLGPTARAGRWADLGVAAAAADAAPSAPYAAATALAALAARDAGLPLDLLHSRLAPISKSRIGRATAMAIGAGVLVVFAFVAGYVNLHRMETDLADRKQHLAEMSKGRKDIEAQVAMIQHAQGWHAEAPRFIGCLRDLTLAMPDDSRVFVTGFTLADSMKGGASGKAGSPANVQLIGERLKASGHFQDVKTSFDVKDSRTGADARSGQEVSFTINFLFVPHDDISQGLPR